MISFVRSQAEKSVEDHSWKIAGEIGNELSKDKQQTRTSKEYTFGR